MQYFKVFFSKPLNFIGVCQYLCCCLWFCSYGSLSFLFWLVWLRLCEPCWFFQRITLEPFMTSALTFLYLAICCFGGLDSSYYLRLWGTSLGYLKYPLVFHISTINFSLRNALAAPHSSSKLCLHFIFFKKI